MIFFCEECGERYILEPEDLGEARIIVFPCRGCNDVIEVTLPGAAADRKFGVRTFKAEKRAAK